MGPRACIARAMCKLPRPPPQAIREQVTQLLKGVPLMRVSGGSLESKEKVRCALRSPGSRRLRERPGLGAGRDAAPRGWARALQFSRGQVQVPWGSEALPETLPCLSPQTPRELRQPPQSLGYPSRSGQIPPFPKRKQVTQGGAWGHLSPNGAPAPSGTASYNLWTPDCGTHW